MRPSLKSSSYKNKQKYSLQDWLESKILYPQDIRAWRQKIEEESKTIVTLNGSFDLMHSGHLEIIFQASKLGDVLVVGLNTDRSIQSYKSQSRPIIKLSDRMSMIAAIGLVDHVSYFDETTPCAWLEMIRGHIHVNGAEYGLNCIESETLKKIGSKLHLVERVPGLATSEIIEKIKKL